MTSNWPTRAHPLPVRQGALLTLALVALAYCGVFGFQPAPRALAQTRDHSFEARERARMAAQSNEPGGTPEESLWEVLVLMGVGDTEPTSWNTDVRISDGELYSVDGYRFSPPDRVHVDGGWRISTQVISIEPLSTFRHRGRESFKERPVPKGVLLRGAGNSSTRITLVARGQSFSFAPMNIPVGSVNRFVRGRVEVWRVPAVTDLSGTELRQHDSPALAAGSDGQLWGTWLSFHNRREELNLRVFRDGRWSRLIPVPRAAEDLWRPQVAADGNGTPWLVWSQQIDGNWDIYAMPRDGDDAWGNLYQLSDDPLPDIEPHVAASSEGTIYVVWQSWSGGRSNVRMRYLDDGEWSQLVTVSDTATNDWAPAVAVGSDGLAWIAWDRYTTSYDVYARSFSPRNGLSKELKVAASNRYEAHVSVVVDRQDRPWIAWETGGVNWGKDLGHFLGANSPGSPLGDRRRIEIVAWDRERWRAPAELHFNDSLKMGSSGESRPLLYVDPAGDIWLAFRRRYSFNVFDRSVYWETYLTRLEGDRWSNPILLPESWNRKSTRMGLASARGRLWAFWSEDNRKFPFAGRPFANRVNAGSIPLPEKAPVPRLSAYRAPPDAAPPGHANEAGDIRAMRQHRVTVAGTSFELVRGELHRHTELSPDVGGLGDGTLFESYRYMIDAAGLDFGAPTDHQGGGVDYSAFMILKAADMYHLRDRFVTFYGYERNPTRPFGHRNIFHTQRDYPIVPFFQRVDPRFMLPETPDAEILTQNSGDYGGVNRDDLKLLYEELRKSGGLAIPHTTAGSNEWRDIDADLDPVVEIYQGARGTSDHPGAPRDFRKRDFGYAWDAWNKGYRIGVIASSDHFSTHISYAMVYTPNRTRRAIFDSIVKRRTYGATDNILLEFWLGDQFMGDDFEASSPQRIRVKARGTAPVKSVHLIRDGLYVYETSPLKNIVDVDYLDADAGKGQHWYYVRVEQEDGQLAWSSPIWVKYK